MTALLEVQELIRDFGGLRAVSDLSLSLGSGEMLAIVGPNGCGKTTFFNLISGALKPTSGAIRFKGKEISRQDPQAIAAVGIKRKFQVPSVFSDMRVDRNLLLAALGGEKPGGPLQLLGRFQGERDLEKLLAIAGLQDKALVSAGALSHGERQRLEIVMALAGRAELLLLDEPTAGMTLVESQAIAELLLSLRNEEDSPAVLIIEHDMKVVEALACNVAVMVQGRFVKIGSYEDVSRDPRVREAYIGPGEEWANAKG